MNFQKRPYETKEDMQRIKTEGITLDKEEVEEAEAFIQSLMDKAVLDEGELRE